MKITLTELKEILATEAEVKALRIERELLKKQIMELVAGDEAMRVSVQEAFDKSEAVESKMRAAIANRPAS